MPRDTDPTPAPQRPLGERVTKPAKPDRDEWEPVPGNPRIERNKRDGKLRTNLPWPRP